MRRREATRGFTLIEMIIVLAIMIIVMAIGFPALQNMIYRSKVEGTVREAAVLMRAARLDAIKRSNTFYVQADFTGNQVVVWRETGTTSGFSADDEQIHALKLPAGLDF